MYFYTLFTVFFKIDYLLILLPTWALIKIHPFLQSKKWEFKSISFFSNLVWIHEKRVSQTFRAIPKEVVGVSFVQRHSVDRKCLWWCTRLLSHHLCEKCGSVDWRTCLFSPPPPKSSPWWNWFVSLFQSNGVIAGQLSACWIVKNCFWGQCQPLWPLWTVTWVRIAGIRAFDIVMALPISWLFHYWRCWAFCFPS